MSGKKQWLTLVLAWLLGVLPMAAGVPCKTAGGDSYEVALLGVGGQNRTWAGYGGGALQLSLPVWENLDIQSGFQGLSSGVMTGLLHVQPVFSLKKGELLPATTAGFTNTA